MYNIDISNIVCKNKKILLHEVHKEYTKKNTTERHNASCNTIFV